MRILVVDDDPQLLMILQAALRKLGHQVETAPDGQQALTTFRASPFPLVVCDWSMPVMDGPTLCRALRAEAGARGGADVYVIMLTARTSSADQVESLHAGADDFLPKPFDIADLTASIRAAERVLASPVPSSKNA